MTALSLVSIASEAAYCMREGVYIEIANPQSIQDFEQCMCDATCMNGEVATITYSSSEYSALASATDTGQVLPEPEKIAESIGAGFFMMFPLMATVWGGRQLIGMFRA